MNTIDRDLTLAHRLADAADAIALRHFATGCTAWRAKSDGSPVSAADEQIELALRARIQRERPGDAVLGEEFGNSGAGRRRWVIDAVDGTASFLAGEPEWSTLIALEDSGGIAAAARITRPALNWAGPSPTREVIPKPSTGTGTCHGALLVATGQLDAFLLLGAGPWDIAPLVPIIQAAGGSYDDLTVGPSTGSVSALFTNHALRHQILNASNHRF